MRVVFRAWCALLMLIVVMSSAPARAQSTRVLRQLLEAGVPEARAARVVQSLQFSAPAVPVGSLCVLPVSGACSALTNTPSALKLSSAIQDVALTRTGTDQQGLMLATAYAALEESGVPSLADVELRFGPAGELVLTGTVGDDGLRQMAEARIKSVPGVPALVNQVETSPTIIQRVPSWNAQAGEARLARALNTLVGHDMNALRGGSVVERLLEVDPGLTADPNVVQLVLSLEAGIDVKTITNVGVRTFLNNSRHRSALVGESPLSPFAKPAVKDPFWDSAAPSTWTRDGQEYALTFSMDSELPVVEAFRLYLGDRNAFRWYQSTISREVLEAQGGVRQFLRRGVATDKSAYSIAELKLPGRWADGSTAPAKQTLRDMGYPVNTHWDGDNILEMNHESFEPVPSVFWQLMRRMHNEIENPQTHLHLGIPAAAMTRTELNAVGRAVEMRAVLHRATLPSNVLEPAAGGTGSLLRNTGYLGPVSLVYKRFKTPRPTHDLELRQWDHREGDYIEYGMGLIAFAGRLSQNANRLMLVRGYFGFPNHRAANLRGSLEYAALTLARSTDARTLEVSDELNALALKLKDSRQLTLELRAEVREFLVENDVDALLANEDLYLSPTVLRAPPAPRPKVAEVESDPVVTPPTRSRWRRFRSFVRRWW